MTKHESRSYEAHAVAGRVVILPNSNGRELGSRRLKARIQKSVYSDVADRNPELIRHAMQRYTRISTPEAFMQAEHAFRAIQDHSRVRLKSWDLDEYRQNTSLAEAWAAAACLAGHAISTGHGVKSNYKILNKSGAEFKSILQQQEPTLVWSTFTVIMNLFQVYPRLGIAFIHVVTVFCSQLPADDPLNRLWASISKTDPGQILELMAQLTKVQLDFLRKEVASTNVFVLNYVRTSAKYLHDRRLLTPQAAHDQMNTIIRSVGPSLDPALGASASIKNVLVAAYLFKACIHLDAKEYREVEKLLRKVDPKDHDAEGMDCPQMVNFYEIKAEMLLERGEYDDSEYYYWKAHDIAKEKLSETMPSRIGYFYVALGQLYRRKKDKAKLKRVREIYDDHLWQMTGNGADHPPFEFAEWTIPEPEEDDDFV